MEDFLRRHGAKKPISFHMPGHKGAALYKRFGHEGFLHDFLDYDITEIPGADNLFQREGIIAQLAARYQRLYQVEESFPLINGTSCGLMAAILSVVPRGGKLILARNCHKSVFNAMSLGGILPVYGRPEMVEEWGISGELLSEEIERLIVENPDASAVILPSPNYYGICSDIQAIAEVVHRYGMILIVDQAHGAHLHFFHQYGGGEDIQFPINAEKAGADIVVNSIHKTLGSMTQSAVMNLCSRRVASEDLEDKLQMLESTSPSYILMASLDINGQIIEEHGEDLFREWKDNLDWFYQEAEKVKGLRVMAVDNLDPTKLNLDLSEKGFTGRMLEKALIEKYGIYSELNTGNILMCMTGMGNTREDYSKLLNALEELSEITGYKEKGEPAHSGSREQESGRGGEGSYSGLMAQRGQTCLRSVIPYPPGIPLICPGEEVSQEQLEELVACLKNEDKVLGLTQEGRIKTKEG